MAAKVQIKNEKYMPYGGIYFVICELFKEHIWLVKTIYQARNITLNDINKEWLKTEMSGGVEMARSTFNRHKLAIADVFGIYIECDRSNDYKYFKHYS